MTRARDIAGGTIFTGADHTKLDGIATGATAYVHPTGAGNQHVPAAGAAGQLLQYASAGTAAWANISTDADDVVFPNLASPNNTYTASGTWSKGSLSDDDYVWIYLVGGGGGGLGDSSGTIRGFGAAGGGARLIYGKAKFLDGGAYVIGAGADGVVGNSPAGSTASTFTLSSSNGGEVYATTTASDNTVFITVDGKLTIQSTTLIEASPSPAISFLFGSPPTGWAGLISGSIPRNPDPVWSAGAGSGSNTDAGNAIFGGGGGGGRYNVTDKSNGGSLYAGAGGVVGSSGADGTYPGGGGGGSSSYNNAGGDGADGNMRVYHV